MQVTPVGGQRWRAALVVLLAGATFAPAATAGAQSSDPLPLLELVQGDGSGRLYTLSQQEANAAVAQHGMRLQPVRTGYVRSRPFAESQPLHRLSRRSDGARLITSSESERSSLLASARFTYDGVVGHASRVGRPGMRRLLRYSNAGEWRLVLDGAGAPPGYRLDGSVGYVDVRWIRAGALYFGMWNGGTRNVIDATKRVYGRDDDWWGGVRDYSGADPSVPVNRWAWPRQDFSYLLPAIGFYDDTQTRTVEQHITQAASAGLRYFAFYWYWSGKTGQETIAGGLHSFLRARNRGAMDFALTVCSHAWGTGSLAIPRSQYATAAAALVEYMRQPNYLRANDGRRLLWLCDTRGLASGSNADVRAFVDTLRARARAVLGESILVLAHRDLGHDLAAVGADGSYCGARYPPDRSYRTYVNSQRAYLAGGPPVFVRCAMSDFDERPRYPMFYTTPEQARYMVDRTPALFGQAVRNVRDEMATSTRSPLVDNFVLFYSWNEWHEGGIPLEPNARDGCANLDIVRTGLGLTSGPGCIARPPDEPAAAPPPVVAPVTRSLRLGLRIPRKQNLRRRSVIVRVRCSQPCRVKARGHARPPAGRKAPRSARLPRARLRSRARRLVGDRWTKMRLKASRRSHRRIRTALRTRDRLRVQVTVRGTPRPDGAMVSKSKARTVRITRRR